MSANRQWHRFYTKRLGEWSEDRVRSFMHQNMDMYQPNSGKPANVMGIRWPLILSGAEWPQDAANLQKKQTLHAEGLCSVAGIFSQPTKLSKTYYFIWVCVSKHALNYIGTPWCSQSYGSVHCCSPIVGCLVDGILLLTYPNMSLLVEVPNSYKLVPPTYKLSYSPTK